MNLTLFATAALVLAGCSKTLPSVDPPPSGTVSPDQPVPPVAAPAASSCEALAHEESSLLTRSSCGEGDSCRATGFGSHTLETACGPLFRSAAVADKIDALDQAMQKAECRPVVRAFCPPKMPLEKRP